MIAEEPIVAVPSLRDYYKDLDSIILAASEGESKSFAYKRLQYLDGKWNLYILLNERQEMADSKVLLFKITHLTWTESAASRLLQC
jgi:AMP deaminase